MNNRFKFITDIQILWLEQILEVRANWPLYVIYSIFLPIAMIFGFTRLGNGLTDETSLLYIISGAAIFTTANNGIYVMAMRVSIMKRDGMLIYYASLPIHKTSFIIAILLSRLLIILPGMLTPLVFGELVYDVQFQYNIWVIVLLLLTALSLSAVGMAIGSWIDNPELISVVVNGINFVTALVAPVFIPAENLPLVLRWFGYVLPPTYAASALRDTLTGITDGVFYLNVLVLFLMTIASLVIVNSWIRWQLK